MRDQLPLFPEADHYADPLFVLLTLDLPEPDGSPAYERWGFVVADVPRTARDSLLRMDRRIPVSPS